MKLTIEPTGEFRSIEGAPCRLWTGTDDRGTEVHVYVLTLSPQTHDLNRLARFDADLERLPPLRQEGMTIDYRFIAD